MGELTIGPASRQLGIREDTLKRAVQAGWIQSYWGKNIHGQRQRMFTPEELESYQRRQVERRQRASASDFAKEIA